MQSWININRIHKLEYLRHQVYSEKIYLTEDFEKYDKFIPGITLLDHQKITVQAMVDLELKRFIKLDLTGNNSINFTKSIVETNAGILSEKPGSGKTYEILALIMINKKLNKIPEILTFKLFDRASIIQSANREHFHYSGYTTEVRKSYDFNYGQTLIFVGKSVIKQWEEKIQEVGLSYFVIGNIRDFREFYTRVLNTGKDQPLFQYKPISEEIILVKNGTFSGRFEIPELSGTCLEDIRGKYLISVFGEIFKRTSFARVVLDDFDVLNIPKYSPSIPANFTWFVSATKRPYEKKKNISDSVYDPKSLLLDYRPNYSDIWKNEYLFTFFNIGCLDSFIDKSISASKINYFLYKFINKNRAFINFIEDIGNITIAEMLNGDAIQTAAEELGLKTGSVAEIFEKILDKSWYKYKKTIEIETYVQKIKEYLTGLKNQPDQINPDQIIRNIRKPGPLTEFKELVKFKNPEVEIVLDKEIELNQKNKLEDGKAIQRLKDNLKENECPILCVPLNNCGGILILKCCGVAISKEAGEMIFNKSDVDCPKCRSKITPKKVIFIDQDNEKFIDKILKDDILEEPKIVLPKPKLEPSLDIDKFECIIRIILGQKLDSIKKKYNFSIPGILSGLKDLGEAPEKDRKFIIFSNWDETTNKIQEKLILFGLKYRNLLGSNYQIEEIVKKYKLDNQNPESIQILLITGPKYCAGLNLQNTTDLIFTHRIIDTGIEVQIAGRGARYGRTNNFNIHYVLYDTEI